MFEKFLMRFRFTRNWLRERVKRSLGDLITKVGHQGSFTPEDITTLHNIVKSPVVQFKEETVLGVSDDIKFFTNTSMSALSALEKKDEIGLNFGKNGDITTSAIARPFTKWYSNQISVELFVSTLAPYIERQTLIEQRQVDKAGNLLFPLTIDEEQFFESLIYRLLKLDMMEIVMFYLSRVED